jgi:hypothetical protein
MSNSVTFERTFSGERYERTVNGMRSWLSSIARKRVNGTVTADDAHTYLDREGVSRGHVRARLSFINSVLRSPNFEYAGMTPSTRPVARGRMITEWTTR